MTDITILERKRNRFSPKRREVGIISYPVSIMWMFSDYMSKGISLVFAERENNRFGRIMYHSY